MDRYDAFISYSHGIDPKVPARLKSGLESVARPWYQLRTLRIFLDNSNLAASPGLWTSIEERLAASRWFILLASKHSASSAGVAREVDWWLKHRSIDSMILVLIDGNLDWDTEAGHFSAETDALPASLAAAFREEPKYVDLRWAENASELSHTSIRFRSTLLELAAPIRGIEKDDLDGEAVRALRRNRAWAAAALTLLAGATVWALGSRSRALENEARTSIELAARQAVGRAQTKDQLEALPLAILNALRGEKEIGAIPTSALAALRQGIESGREVRRWKVTGQPMGIAFDAGSEAFAVTLRDNEVRKWSLSGKVVGFGLEGGLPANVKDDQFLVSVNPSRRVILLKHDEARYSAWSTEGKQLATDLDSPVVELSKSGTFFSIDRKGRLKRTTAEGKAESPIRLPGARPTSLHASRDGRTLVIVHDDGLAEVRDLVTGKGWTDGPACREGNALTKQDATFLSVGCGEARLLDLRTKSVLIRQDPGLSLVKELAASDEGGFAVTHKRDDRIDWFNDRGLRAGETLLGPDDPRIAISPDGRWLVAAGYLDQTARVFDLRPRTGRILTPPGKLATVTSVDACPETATVVWSTQDGEIQSAKYLRPYTDGQTWRTASGEYVEAVRCTSLGIAYAMRGGTVFHQLSSTSVPKALATEEGGVSNIAALRDEIYFPTSRGILRWNLAEARMLSTLANPIPNASWWRVSIGNANRTLLVGSATGSIGAVDIASGKIVIPEKRTLWSNTWAVAPDVSDSGFVVAGAGTEAAIVDWAGEVIHSIRTDQFLFASDAGFDSRRDLLVIPTMSGDVLVLDQKGSAVGPPIRNVGDNQFVSLRLTRDGRLLVGGLAVGVSVEELDASRLLDLACQLIGRIETREMASSAIFVDATAKCSARANSTATSAGA